MPAEDELVPKAPQETFKAPNSLTPAFRKAAWVIRLYLTFFLAFFYYLEQSEKNAKAFFGWTMAGFLIYIRYTYYLD